MLLAQSRSMHKQMSKLVTNIPGENGLQVHSSKTNFISWDQFTYGRTSIQIAGMTFSILAEEDSERYLGRKFCLHNCQSVELQNRIAAGWAKFHSLKAELTGKAFSVAARLRLFEAVVNTTVLCGACTWALTRTMAHELDVAGRSIFWRKDSVD